MADNSVAATTTHRGAHRGSTSNLTYTFSGAADELHDEFTCLMSEATSIINTLAIDLGEDGSQMQANPKEAAQMLWSALRTMELATSVAKSLDPRIVARQGEG
ncbi:hypothetical protein N800_06685 [Lysobacter daejeonensis GH1-9]|uniref:Uncharacterized protein n=1 Tax=Lysobacter daejeonensis GH1-9 TaxID=1385517 RepID=A0A0A0EUN9_9GAMM|nr:hypothetical protein [Lysobacter daejeonensis]KGM54661.1 hypothetical protein N800_06685 [Lysobacter daejeonensis GH1-9]